MTQDYNQFPSRLAFGVQVASVSQVDIVELASGHEKRNARIAKPRARYVLPGTNRPIEEARALLNFFNRQGGPLTPFLLDDPFDNTTAVSGISPAATDIVIGKGDGLETRFTLRSRAGRIIRFPDDHTLSFAVSGITVAVNDFEFSDGAVIFKTAPHVGAEITFGCRFRVLVRFGDEHITVNQVTREAGAHGDLQLVEVLQ